MPNTIVVVDDEKLVVFGICSLLEEQNACYEILASCTSGEEALKICMEKKPNLLLTDIGMPGMDGLKLIEMVRRTNPSMKIAVLSCHDEYELVHEAFLLGADDYILKKEIDKIKLGQLVNRLLPETDEESQAEKVINRIPMISEMHDFVPFSAGSIGIIGFKSEAEESLMWQPDIPMLRQLIDDDIKPHGRFFIGFHNDLIIYFPDLGSEGEYKLDILLTKIRRSVSKYVNREIFIAKYMMKTGEEVLHAYREGLKILQGLFYYNKSTVLTVKPQRPERLHSLRFEISSSDYKKEWLTLAEDFIDYAALEFISPEAVKNELIFSVKQLLCRLEDAGCKDIGIPAGEDKEPYYQRISEFEDSEELKEWFLGFIEKIAAEMKSGRYLPGIVGNAKNYISEHIRDDLRLSTVAYIVGSTPNHLSTLFKKSTGESYIEYVNRMRIEHARMLLQTTDCSAKEIAFKCGYANPNYFSRIFKKISGTTISEYRMEKTGICESKD